MVQHDTSSSSDDTNKEEVAPQFPDTPAKGIPFGKYKLVGWAVDTTGRRLIDEIVHVAAYTPQSQFSQYIMPFTDLNPNYSRKHSVRVVNTFRYRRLKDMKTGQFLKTKSEISALIDFLQWLETAKADTDGIILIFHEARKSIPAMLLEAMKRNNLTERFKALVVGFANGYHVAKSKCEASTKTFNLKVMSGVLLGKENVDLSSAVDRAALIYDIACHLAQGEREELDIKAIGDKTMTGTETDLIELVCPHTNPISAEEEEIETFKVLLQKQNTFRPVFGALMRASPTERQHASHLRRLLAENDILYEKLKETYESDAKEGLEKIIKEGVPNAKEADLNELLEILDCFFDPKKKPVQPKTVPYYNYNRGGGYYRRSRPKSFSKGGRRSKSQEKKDDNKDEKSAEDGTEANGNTDTTASTETSPRSEDKAVKQEVPAN